MPEIKSFKGYRYNPDKFPKPEEVLSPPYDVISAKAQEALYAKSPRNFVRLDFKKTADCGPDFYRSTANELNQWIEEGVFVREPKEAVYVYVQDYRNLKGEDARRIGFISLVRIDPAKTRTHEKTLDGPKLDRMALLDALKANLSPVFAFFQDPKGEVQRVLKSHLEKKPVIDALIDSVRHRLYVEDNPEHVRLIRDSLGPKPMYIADGHHRHEVSYQYSLVCEKENRKEKESARYVMAYLTAANLNDLTVYPTHRVLNLEGDWKGEFEALLSRNFSVKAYPGVREALADTKKHASSCAVTCVVRDDSKKGESGNLKFLNLLPKAKLPDDKNLDLFMAQELLILPLLKGEAVSKTQKMRYTRNIEEALDWVRCGESSLAVLLAEMPVAKIIEFSDKGVALPQKSTFFYPKLLSGLVFYKF